MQDVLAKLHDTQVEILQVIDRICKEHNLRYSLYAGSLLGAVRHKDFIPWDDDLDICMPREDYNRFISIWQDTEHNGYILQNKESEPLFTQTFTKIRKDHTTFLQSMREAGAYHTGIFVDIFPVDRLPSGKLAQLFFYWHCMYYLLLTREFVPPLAGKFTQIVSTFLLRLTPSRNRAARRKKLLQKITRYNKDSSLPAVTTETIGAVKQHHHSTMLDNYITLPFHRGAFSCFAGWDQHLHTKYGDYMQLPPEEERVWKHHPILIDFEHNYEEIPEGQKNSLCV